MTNVCFFDLDGTLLTWRKTINRQNMQALRRLQSQGYEVVIVTGRPVKFVEQLLAKYDLNIKAICFNGAYLADEFSYPIICYKDLISHLDKHMLIVKTLDAVYCNKIIPSIFTYPKMKIFNNYELLKISDPVYKIIIPMKSADYIESVLNKFEVKFFRYGNKGYEVAQINKAQAIKKYLHKKDYNQVYIFADGENDIEMAKLNYHNIIMSNGNSELKKYAEIVVDNSFEKGVTKGVDYILQEGKNDY